MLHHARLPHTTTAKELKISPLHKLGHTVGEHVAGLSGRWACGRCIKSDYDDWSSNAENTSFRPFRPVSSASPFAPVRSLIRSLGKCECACVRWDYYVFIIIIEFGLFTWPLCENGMRFALSRRMMENTFASRDVSASEFTGKPIKCARSRMSPKQYTI